MTAEASPFFSLLKAHFEKVRGKDALSAFREQAWERFISMGLPSKNNEAFQTVSLRDLYTWSGNEDAIVSEKAVAVLPECRHSHVVFVDGVFCPQLSDTSGLASGSVVLSPLAQAMRTSGQFLQSHWLKGLKEEKDPFALLNFALHGGGLFLYIAPGQAIQTPIQCIQMATKEDFSAPRIQLVLGSHSSVKWISTQTTLSTCSSPLIDLFLNEGARLDFSGHLSPNPASWCFDSIRGYLKRDAVFKATSVIDGSKATRQNIYVQCAGENSEVDIKGLWMLKGHLRAHAFAVIDHRAPHTRSMQLFKGILLDASQSSFEGKILVREAAQKTEAYQLNKSLILGHAALAFSKPNLEIFADDVKASHGATIARPDAAQLFYLKSRGIDEKKAQRLLMSGFYHEILDQIPYPVLREKINAAMEGDLT